MNYAPYTGKMYHPIGIYKYTGFTDDGGEQKRNRVGVCNTFAAMEEITGKMETDEKVHHVTSTVFVIRNREGVYNVAELEVYYEGVYYRVIHVAKLGRSHLKITCTNYD